MLDDELPSNATGRPVRTGLGAIVNFAAGGVVLSIVKVAVAGVGSTGRFGSTSMLHVAPFETQARKVWVPSASCGSVSAGIWNGVPSPSRLLPSAFWHTCSATLSHAQANGP